MSEKPTREQILSEPAGERLDAWVAEFVMGRKVASCETHGGVCCYSLWPDAESVSWRAVAEVGRGDRIGALTADHYRLAPYSRDVAIAWEIVEKMGRWHGFIFMVRTSDGFFPHAGDWEAGWYEESHEGPEGRVYAQADTVPLCIARAALLAVLDEA